MELDVLYKAGLGHLIICGNQSLVSHLCNWVMKTGSVLVARSVVKINSEREFLITGGRFTLAVYNEVVNCRKK